MVYKCSFLLGLCSQLPFLVVMGFALTLYSLQQKEHYTARLSKSCAQRSSADNWSPCYEPHPGGHNVEFVGHIVLA